MTAPSDQEEAYFPDLEEILDFMHTDILVPKGMDLGTTGALFRDPLGPKTLFSWCWRESVPTCGWCVHGHVFQSTLAAMLRDHANTPNTEFGLAWAKRTCPPGLAVLNDGSVQTAQTENKDDCLQQDQKMLMFPETEKKAQ